MEQRRAAGAVRCRLESPQRDPWHPNCQSGAGIPLVHPTPASAVPKHIHLGDETIFGTVSLCLLSIFFQGQLKAKLEEKWIKLICAQSLPSCLFPLIDDPSSASGTKGTAGFFFL